ncbi:MAG TPA: DUF2459 domain-containing protein, partial [Gammaproteobacteria bacterium]|nr:DUF2459 domain-containing protein [Gammaproteobacteria bacterium]
RFRFALIYVNVSQRLIPVIACSLLLIAGCASPGPVHSPPSPLPDSATQATAPRAQVWVLDSGWHTGLILARAELGPTLTRLLQPARDAQYLMFGWGNRRFYMSSNPTIGMDIAALFPSQSVVLVEGCNSPPRACYTPEVQLRHVSVTAGGLERLDGYLAASLQTDAQSRLEPLTPGPDTGSEFYASGLSYDAFHTCNTWTAEALHVAGVPVTYHGVIFADQLWRQLQ